MAASPREAGMALAVEHVVGHRSLLAGEGTAEGPPEATRGARDQEASFGKERSARHAGSLRGHVRTACHPGPGWKRRDFPPRNGGKVDGRHARGGGRCLQAQCEVAQVLQHQRIHITDGVSSGYSPVMSCTTISAPSMSARIFSAWEISSASFVASRSATTPWVCSTDPLPMLISWGWVDEEIGTACPVRFSTLELPVGLPVRGPGALTATVGPCTLGHDE